MANTGVARSTKTVIYETIKTRIMDMELKPGDTLSDSKLARELKVSRTPVREALNLLQTENYVEYHSERGFFVKGINLKNIEDMYTVREALEVAALRLAATKDVDEDVEAIAHLLDEHAAIIGDFNGQTKFLEDAEFHRALIRMGRNAYLMKIVESIFVRI
jgi:DNA-binding GntR family transcriptional regulator